MVDDVNSALVSQFGLSVEMHRGDSCGPSQSAASLLDAALNAARVGRRGSTTMTKEAVTALPDLFSR
jgi:hypothetical protein